MRKIALKGSQAKKIIDAFNARIALSPPLNSKSKVEEVKGKNDSSSLYYVDDKPLLMRVGDKLMPTLIHVQALAALPRIRVDEGAIVPICKGADIMAPGIREISRPYVKGELVVVEGGENGRALCVGEALISSEEGKNLEHGKAIKNLHHAGDNFWRHIREKWSHQ